MSQKRQPEEEGKLGSDGASPEEKRQKIPALREVVVEALKMNALQKLLAAIEPLVRRVVKEEVELALSNHLVNMTRQCGKQIYPSTSRSLQLQFRNKLSLPIFTGTKIEGEDSPIINIALVDALTGQVVMSGLESMMKVEIVVLEGDFEGNQDDNWTFEEFKNNIVREREGKRSLLTGDVFLDLVEGTGAIGELSFTDNSSWTRSRKFRLGARIIDGYFNGMRVREAKTEPFMVKDHRGELYKKHYPPSIWDEVWRLEKIGKDGAFHKRLSNENINTVKDFLTLLSTDAPRLRNILGSGMSAKMWEVTVEHSRTCTLPSQMYVYFANNSQQRKRGASVVFNIVGEVMGLLSQHQFVSVHDLSESEKADAHSLVKLALENRNDVMAYDDMAGTSSHSQALSTAFPSGSNTQPFPDNIYSSSFGPNPVNKDATNAADGAFGFISSPDGIFECTRGTSVSDNTFALQTSLHGIGSRYQHQEPTHRLLGCHSIEELDECVGSQALFFSGDDSLQHYLDSDVSLLSQSLHTADSPADLGTAVTGFLAMSARTAAARVKAYTVWGMLLSVLRWRFSIKKIVASKKRTHQKERFC